MLTFRHATDRQTKAYIIHVGDHALYVSYETVIAYEGPAGRCRLDNVWGPTTGRHMGEMGVKDWPIVSRDELHERVNRAMSPRGVVIPTGAAREMFRLFDDVADGAPDADPFHREATVHAETLRRALDAAGGAS